MRLLNLKIELPDTICNYDVENLEKQLSEIAKILVLSNSSHDKKKDLITDISHDPFACFSGSWGGDTPVDEYCEGLRHSDINDREIGTW